MMNSSIHTKFRAKKKQKLSIPQLPAHITIEILSRLPLKTLLHCQLVCQEWLSLISNPHFAKLHLSKSPPSLLIRPIWRNAPGCRQLRLLDLRLQTLPETHPRDAQLKLSPKVHFPILGHKVVNSCNGLLCLYELGRDAVFVCNPILGENILVPLSKRAEYGGGYDKTTFAFGFSPRTHQYKVVQFFLIKLPFDDPLARGEKAYRQEVKAEIYTLGSGLWRNLGRVPYHPGNKKEYRSFCTSLNGALHWLTFDRGSSDFIRCFDFGSERFRVVPEPCEFGVLKKEFPDRVRLGVLGDKLSICDFSRPPRVEIWMMRDYGIKESWSKWFVIENAIAERGGQLDYCEPITILEGGEILMLVNKNALVQYNPKLGGFKKLNIYGIKSEFYATSHIPSFVSLADVAKGERLTVYCKRKRSSLNEAWLRDILKRIVDYMK